MQKRSIDILSKSKMINNNDSFLNLLTEMKLIHRNISKYSINLTPN